MCNSWIFNYWIVINSEVLKNFDLYHTRHKRLPLLRHLVILKSRSSTEYQSK